MTIQQLTKTLSNITGREISYDDDDYQTSGTSYITNERRQSFILVKKSEIEHVTINSFEGMNLVNQYVKFLVR